MLLGALLALPTQEVGFAGLWERDAERSDEPAEKMKAAMAQGGQLGRRGGGGRGRRPPGVSSGRPGREGREGGGRPELGNIPDELRVEMDDDEFRAGDGERLRIYYLDGEKHRREMGNGMKLETVSELKGNAVVIEEKMEHGKIDRKFEMSPDGGTMIMTLTVRFGPMTDPVLIKTVYARVGEAGETD